MAAEHILHTPIKAADVVGMELGDLVYITGEMVITAGLPTHKRIMHCLENGESLPIDLKNAVFFHLGGLNRESNGRFETVYVNPTTSTRFNPFMPKMIKSLQFRVVGGKGGLDENCVQAMKEVGCVYLSALGGGCALYSRAIKDVSAVAWQDLVPHYRLVKLKVEKFGPLVVAIDAKGKSIYENISDRIASVKNGLLES